MTFCWSEITLTSWLGKAINVCHHLCSCVEVHLHRYRGVFNGTLQSWECTVCHAMQGVGHSFDIICFPIISRMPIELSTPACRKEDTVYATCMPSISFRFKKDNDQLIQKQFYAQIVQFTAVLSCFITFEWLARLEQKAL